MRKLIYILIFLPLLSFGQMPDLLQLASWQKNNSNLYVLANAANPNNEVNAVTDIVDRDTRLSITSSSTTPQSGTYALRLTHTGTTNQLARAYFDFPTDGVSSYKVDIYFKEVSGLNWNFTLESAFGWVTEVTTLITANGVWTLHTLTGVSDSSTGRVQFGGTSASDGGNILDVDNIVITKL